MLAWFLVQGFQAQESPEELVRALGDPDIEVRLRAAESLYRKCPEVAGLLRTNRSNPDQEIASRCRDLLSKFEPEESPRTWILQGKIAFVHESRKLVAVDLRPRDGAWMNQVLEVWEEDVVLGRIRVVEIHGWGLWAAAEDDGLFEILRKGDPVRWGPDD